MPVVLYWTLISQPSRAVKCLLEIAKIEYKLEQINLMGGQEQFKEYRTINHLGQIPFIIDNGFKLAESSAILVYLCQKYPEKLEKMYGKNQKERAKINQYLSLYQSVYRPVVFKILFLKIYKGMSRKRPIYTSQIKAAKDEMMKTLQLLQKGLKQSNTFYLAGDTASIADILFFFQTTNFMLYEMNIDDFKLIKNWFNRMLQVQQLKRCHEEWLQLAPGMIQMLNSLPVVEKSKL